MAQELPNLELLIKLMKMTTSSTDGEALNAIRMANASLAKCGGDWEVLLRGKLAPIDPFMTLPEPPRAAPRPTPTPPQWTRPQTPPPPPRVYGLNKKEARDIATWISKIDFSSKLNHQHVQSARAIEKNWTQHKQLSQNDYTSLRYIANLA